MMPAQHELAWLFYRRAPLRRPQIPTLEVDGRALTLLPHPVRPDSSALSGIFRPRSALSGIARVKSAPPRFHAEQELEENESCITKRKQFKNSSFMIHRRPKSALIACLSRERSLANRRRDDVVRQKESTNDKRRSKSNSPAERSMAFDVIRDTLQSEGIDEHVSRQLAERANKRQNDVMMNGKLKNAQRLRKKRTISRTSETSLAPAHYRKALPSTTNHKQYQNQNQNQYHSEMDRIRAFLVPDDDEEHDCETAKNRRCSKCLDLDVRKKLRTERDKPWTVGMARGDLLGVLDPVTNLWFPSEKERLTWHQQRQAEVDMGEEYVPPKLVLISSKIRRKDLFLEALSRDESLIPIEYDFDTDTFFDLLEKVKSALAMYQLGSQAKSVLFFCAGGPGYLYLLRGKVLTPPKLKKKDSAEMRWFFEELGGLISRLSPQESSIHIMGCFFLGNKNGFKVLEELSRIMLPNQVSLEAPPELSVEGRRMIERYFNHKRYLYWQKMQEENSSDLTV